MKKLILSITFLVFGLMTYAQDYGVCYTLAAPTSKASFFIGKNNDIYITSTKAKYHCLKDVPAGTLMSTTISDATMLYPIGSTAAATATITTLTSTTSNITTANLTTANVATLNQTGKSTYTSATPMVFNNRVMTKGIDFGTSSLLGSTTFANNAFAYGTNAVPVYVTAVAGHIIPISVSQHVSASGAYDVAAARFRTDADADTACTATFINVIEGRSSLNGTIAGHAGFNMSTSLGSGNVTCTGDAISILAKIEGSGNITSSNHVSPFMSTVTSTGTGINDCGYFSPNGATVTDVVKLETVNAATVTNMLNVANTSGTTTNGINVTGTYSGNAIVTTGNVKANQIKEGGNKLIADTLHFGTNAGGSRNLYARKKISGIVAGDYFVVSPVMASTTAKPGTGEFLGYYCTTDSIVVSRVTATTADLIVTVIRIAK